MTFICFDKKSLDESKLIKMKDKTLDEPVFDCSIARDVKFENEVTVIGHTSANKDTIGGKNATEICDIIMKGWVQAADNSKDPKIVYLIGCEGSEIAKQISQKMHEAGYKVQVYAAITDDTKRQELE